VHLEQVAVLRLDRVRLHRVALPRDHDRLQWIIAGTVGKVIHSVRHKMSELLNFLFLDSKTVSKFLNWYSG
jgi:hypothetical protein